MQPHPKLPQRSGTAMGQTKARRRDKQVEDWARGCALVGAVRSLVPWGTDDEDEAEGEGNRGRGGGGPRTRRFKVKQPRDGAGGGLKPPPRKRR